MNTPGYESLSLVLQRAYAQAAQGKGAERHACSRPFTEQPMQSISDLLGSETGLLYQAMKKIQESQRLDQDAAIRELLGAINYIAGAIIFKEGKQGELPFHLSEKLRREYLSEVAMQGNVCLARQGIQAAQQVGQQALDAGLKTTGDTHWLCYHGNTDVPGKPVRVGEACPVCFATSN